MRAAWLAPELRRFVRDLRVTRDRGALALCALVAVYGLLAVSQVTSSSVRSLALARFHQRIPYTAWAALQPWPAMYNFENRVVVAEPRPDGTENVVDDFSINHHVTRVLYEVGEWRPLTDGCIDYFLISRYRGQGLGTAYRVCRRGTVYTVQRRRRRTRTAP